MASAERQSREGFGLSLVDRYAKQDIGLNEKHIPSGGRQILQEDCQVHFNPSYNYFEIPLISLKLTSR